MARRISGQFLLRWQFPLLSPGPQVWGKRPRPAAVGRGAPQGGPKQENGAPPQQRPRRGEPLSLLVWCSPFGPIWEATPDSPEQQGGFHKEGEGPSFGDSFVSFSSLRKRPQRSASPLPDWQFCARFTIKSETIQNFCIVSFFIYLAAHRCSRYAPQSATRENTLPGLRRSRASVTPSCQAADRQVTPTWSQESTSVAVSPI